MIVHDAKGIAFVRLASLKGRLSLEKAGLEFKGPATRPLIAAEFGLKPRDSYDMYIAAIVAKMNEILAEKQKEGQP